ncbi:MAG: exonuclease domain-containing protein [bacterium]|jgi:DNA polymerase-3 subunit epsilon|nr:3'-5' exonuclease [Betaproteobacteria bacterium]
MMRWLDRILRRRPASAGAASPPRYAVIDTETSGLDVARDRLLTIGAVGVRDGRVETADAFYAVLRQPAPTVGQDILIHRVGTGEQAAGEDPATVLAAFSRWCEGRWAVGFHAGFDRRMIERTLREHRLEPSPLRGWIDLAVVAPLLLAGRAGPGGKAPMSLDEWLDSFGIDDCERHHALGDAQATAQLLLPVLHAAQARGLADPAALSAESEAALKLRAMR